MLLFYLLFDYKNALVDDIANKQKYKWVQTKKLLF